MDWIIDILDSRHTGAKGEKRNSFYLLNDVFPDGPNMFNAMILFFFLILLIIASPVIRKCKCSKEIFQNGIYFKFIEITRWYYYKFCIPLPGNYTFCLFFLFFFFFLFLFLFKIRRKSYRIRNVTRQDSTYIVIYFIQLFVVVESLRTDLKSFVINDHGNEFFLRTFYVLQNLFWHE